MREFIQQSAASAFAYVGRVQTHALFIQDRRLPALTVDLQSGRSDPQVPIYDPASFVIRVWHEEDRGADARLIYNLLRDGIHGKTSVTTTTGRIIYCNETQPGQDITDFDTELPSVLSYWAVGMYATAT